MDIDAARDVLGVGPSDPRDAVRRRYLELMRRHHPDVAGTSAEVDVADLTEAYRVLRTTADTPVGRAHVAVAFDGDTLSVGLPPDETFLELLDVLANVGVVTYIDPEGGLIEVLLELSDGGRCSLVASLQGRAAHGSTDVFLTLDDPAVADVTALGRELAELVDGSLNS